MSLDWSVEARKPVWNLHNIGRRKWKVNWNLTNHCAATLTNRWANYVCLMVSLQAFYMTKQGRVNTLPDKCREFICYIMVPPVLRCLCTKLYSALFVNSTVWCAPQAGESVGLAVSTMLCIHHICSNERTGGIKEVFSILTYCEQTDWIFDVMTHTAVLINTF